jgi:molecular chaperone DnaK
MSLDLDGILSVTSIEKRSGLSKHITIARALEAKSEAEIADARKRLETLFATRRDDVFLGGDDEPLDDEEDEDVDDGIDAEFEVESDGASSMIEGSAPVVEWSVAESEGRQLVERSRGMLDRIHEEDREEAIDLSRAIEAAIERRDVTALQQAIHGLREMLFFIEGRQ